MGQFLHAFFSPLDLRRAVPEVWDGFQTNMKMMVIAEVLVLVFALVIAIVRGLPGRGTPPLRGAGDRLHRLLPRHAADPRRVRDRLGIPSLRTRGISNQSLFVYGVASLTLVYTAYVTEVYRAGIESVHPSQRMAARSLGLTYAQTMRYVVLPQAIRRVVPPLLNDFIGLQKDTAIISVIGVTEALAQARILLERLLQLHRLHGRRHLLRVPDDPARALHRPPDQAARAARASAAVSATEPLRRRRGRHQALRRQRGAARRRPDVDLHQVVCLIGASGSGKSTLLRCLNLLETVDAGTIVVDGQTITNGAVDVNALRRKIGIVFQAYNLFPHMTVLQNVTLAPRKARGLSQAGRRDGEARELLDRIGLLDKADEFPDRLSGGQQQRVAIVRALAMEPKLMLLDEITSALDPQLVAEVLNLVRELTEIGMTMIIATHEMSFAREVADKVCFLDAGVILEEGPPGADLLAPRRSRARASSWRAIIEARAAVRLQPPRRDRRRRSPWPASWRRRSSSSR